MFSLRDFIKKGLKLAIGNKADYEIILSSASWLEKGVLLEEDLAEIQLAIEEKNITSDNIVLPENITPEETSLENTIEPQSEPESPVSKWG